MIMKRKMTARMMTTWSKTLRKMTIKVREKDKEVMDKKEKGRR